MTTPDIDGLVERIDDACTGHPAAKIPWPHRLLHDCREALTHLQEENERLEAIIGGICAYPLCGCTMNECQILDQPPPEICARSDLIETKAREAQLVAALEDAGWAVDHHDAIDARLDGKLVIDTIYEALSTTPEQTKAAAEVIQIAREIYRKSLTDSDTKDDEKEFLEAVRQMEGE